MDFKTLVKGFLFAAAIGWALLNIAGLFMALGQGAGIAHLSTHIVLAVGLSIVAFFLRPWKRPREPVERTIAGDKRIEVLESEVSDLQRQLNETQRGLDFTEQLLKQQPPPKKDV